MGDSPDELGFVAKICDEPHEDLHRLAYADWLDERPPTTVKCPHCRGSDRVQRCHRCYGVVKDSYEHHSGEDYDGTWFCDRVPRCARCGGAGLVADETDRSRAEFIRLDIERHRRWPDFASLSDQDRERLYADHKDLTRVESRLLALARSLPSLQSQLCRECVNGWVHSTDSMSGLDLCPVCRGTGDLFKTPGVSGASLTPPPANRSVVYERGFPGSISCRIAELGDARRCDRCRGNGGRWKDKHGHDYWVSCGDCEGHAFVFTPTPWATAVVKMNPVTRFALTDQRPYRRNGATGGPFSDRLAWDWSSAHVPRFLMDEMAAEHPGKRAGENDSVWWLEFETEAEALDAIALAAGRVVRRAVYGTG